MHMLTQLVSTLIGNNVKNGILFTKCLPRFEPRHDKTYKVSVRPAKTQISLGIRMKKAWVLSYPLSAQRRL